MELLQLEYFNVIAKYQSITQAAEHLRVSQSSLSNMLSRIEGELGVKLFDRHGRAIVLNDYGKTLQQRGLNILQELHHLQREINDLKLQKDAHLSVSSVNARLLANYVIPFAKNFPQITVTNQITNIQTIQRNLLANTVDFAISTTPLNDDLFHHCLLDKDEFVLCVLPEHPLAHLDAVYFHEVANEAFMTLPKTQTKDRLIDYLIQASGIHPNIIFQGEGELLQNAFLHINGVLVSLKSISPLEESQYRMIKLNDDFSKVNIFLSWSKHSPLSPAAKSFLEFLTTTYSPITLA